MSTTVLPLFQVRGHEAGGAIPGRDQADQIAQETKQHQASDATARSENFTADVVLMTRE